MSLPGRTRCQETQRSQPSHKLVIKASVLIPGLTFGPNPSIPRSRNLRTGRDSATGMTREGRECWGRAAGGVLKFSTAAQDSRSHCKGSMPRVQGDDAEADAFRCLPALHLRLLPPPWPPLEGGGLRALAVPSQAQHPPPGESRWPQAPAAHAHPGLRAPSHLGAQPPFQHPSRGLGAPRFCSLRPDLSCLGSTLSVTSSERLSPAPI